MAKSAAVRAEARFKQLCCLGLGGEAAVPALLYELHALIPSFSNSFQFADQKGMLANTYLENPEATIVYPLYQQEFRESREHEFKGFAFSEAARTQVGVQEFRDTPSVDHDTFQRSDLYNLVLRPAGYDSNFLRLYFRSGGRVLGRLSMWRSKGAGSWTSEEKRRLAQLEAFFVHALTVRAVTEATLVDSGEIGLIIADTAGKPVHLSPEGRRLLFLAIDPRSGMGTMVKRPAALPAPIVQLCVSLSQIFAEDVSASPPTWHHSNVWGGFTFRAQWLGDDEPASGLIGITISHKVPLPIRLLRSVERLPLGRRQAQVCMLMAGGASNEKIAEQLGISKHTAIAHGRWIYEKLGVHNRAELVSKLLSN